jgi:ABC-2 type transport system ATP-binding protein
MSPSVVEFDRVIKDYPAGPLGRGRLRAVDGVSLRVGAGEVVGLLGPNRAGKTTLVKLLLSLCRPTAGTVARFGRPAAERATLARVGYVHEAPAFPRYQTAAALLDYFGALALVPAADRRRRIPELLERVGLADRRREPIARFSKGMVGRLGIAQALLNEPDLLVLDEPTEGLDLLGQSLVAEVIESQRRRGGSTLLVSHDVASSARLCDRLAILLAGRVVHDGPPAALPGSAEHGPEEAVRRLYARSAR